MKKVRDIAPRNAASLLGLDVGCGEGHMMSYLHTERAVGKLVAVDLDEDRLHHAKSDFPIFEYVRADVNELNFKANSFDFIIATEILEHLPGPEQVMQELRRVAKINADIIISVPYEPFFHWGNLVRGKHWQRGGRTPAHVNFWNRSEFREFISQFATITREFHMSTFPWLLYHAEFTT